MAYHEPLIYLQTSTFPTVDLPPAFSLSLCVPGSRLSYRTSHSQEYFCPPSSMFRAQDIQNSWEKLTQIGSPDRSHCLAADAQPHQGYVLLISFIYMLPSSRRFSQYVPLGHSYSAMLDLCISILQGSLIRQCS